MAYSNPRDMTSYQLLREFLQMQHWFSNEYAETPIEDIDEAYYDALYIELQKRLKIGKDDADGQ